MTVSANAVFDLQRDAIIKLALQLCGVLEAGGSPDAGMIELGGNLLNVGLRALQNEGILLQSVGRYTQTLTSGTATYTAPADTLDVNGVAYVTSSSGNDLMLTTIPKDRYMEISDKTTGGQPTEIYVEKGSLGVQFLLYPVPDANWTNITYTRIRLLRDLDTGSVTPDLPSKYLRTLTFMLATDLSLHLGSLDKYQALRTEYTEAKKDALNADGEKGSVRFVVETGRRGWRR